MIYGIGVDLTDIERVRKLLAGRRERTLQIIFRPTELEQVRAVAPLREASYVAGRLAAKEAVLKALGTGIGPLAFHEIAITRTDAGQPGVQMYGRAAHLAEELGIRRWHLSISHERGMAIAFAVAEQDLAA
ncbi:MAG: holo-ACP synthase [Chloroflexales bacterium]